ncbi:hypothetical protein Droror1_Dr00013145 [Drosera rotundifolia]
MRLTALLISPTPLSSAIGSEHGVSPMDGVVGDWGVPREDKEGRRKPSVRRADARKVGGRWGWPSMVQSGHL